MTDNVRPSECLTNSTPVLLSPQNVCNPGFYCPNNTASHPPQFCPPTPECQVTRLSEILNTCSSPQGIYEPIVCSPGFYCPRPDGVEQHPCPAGYFCPIGSFEPQKCAHGSICPEGSERQMHMLALGIMLGIDTLLLVGSFAKPAIRQFRGWRHRGRGLDAAENAALNEEDGGKGKDGEEDGASPRGSDGTVTRGHDDSTAAMERLVETFKISLGSGHIGLSMSFKSLEFELPRGRKILHGLTGAILSGSLCGVMGASGAGKSTFVNVLMGKLKNTGGELYINGVRKNISEYKKIIGYVPQDDILLACLTVRENILHSARIRLPSDWSDGAIQAHVDTVISCLQLSHVQHSLVGDVVNPTISGGQRKRVSIGVELVTMPMVLFLDEPTSGLDSSSAFSVMSLLHTLSALGVTVVPVLHQPRTEIFDALEDIILLSEGHVVYTGKREGVQAHFEGLGFVFPSNCNPADVMMDIISGQGHRHRTFERSMEIQFIIEQWRQPHLSADSPRSPSADDHGKPTAEEEKLLLATVSRRGAPWHRQTYFCFQRSMIQQWRQASGFYLEIFVGAVAGLLIGLSVFDLKGLLFQGVFRPPFEVLSSALQYTLVPQLGLLCNLAIGLAGSAPGVRVFGEEKVLYWREAASGHSRSAYYSGKVISTFARIALSALHFTVFFTILATPLMAFEKNYLAVLMYFYCIYGLSGCVSTLASRENGPLLAVITSLITGIICGYGPSLQRVKEWRLEWFWRACPGTWFSEAYFTENLSPLEHLYDLENAAKWTGYTLGQFELDIAMLFVLGTVYRLGGYVGLTFMNRDKQR